MIWFCTERHVYSHTSFKGNNLDKRLIFKEWVSFFLVHRGITRSAKQTHFCLLCYRITNIKSFDFSTLYTTIPHQKLKSRLATIIRNSFLHKNGNQRYKYLVFGREGPYFVKEHSDLKNKYTEEDIIKMLECLVDNIFVVFAGKVFQQIIGIPMGTNCAPLLADIFLYSYEAEFIQSLLSAGKKRLASQFNFTYRYIDDVLSINNPELSRSDVLPWAWDQRHDGERHFCFLLGFAPVNR